MNRTSTPTTTRKKRGVAYRYYILALLTLAYTLSYVDRQIIAIISPYLQADLGLSDWQLGILKGFAFAFLYATCAIPIARIADRRNRSSIIAAAVSVWSVFTAASAAATGFLWLFIARIGVGIGEAGGTAPAHSLISDYFDKSERAKALSIFSIGIPLGLMIAYIGGGYIAETYSWRAALVVVGLPGLVVALLIALTIRDPRAASRNQQRKSVSDESIWSAAKLLFSIPTYRWAAIGLATVSFSANAVGAWIIDLFARAHPDFSLMTVFFSLAVMSGGAYLVGTIVGGVLVDRMAQRRLGVYGWLPAISIVLNLPVFLIAVWVERPEIALWFWLPSHLLSGLYLGPTLALAQTLSPARIRALSASLFYFVVNVIALGLGPTYIGVVASALTPTLGTAVALQIALTSLVLVSLIAVLAYIQVARLIHKDWPTADEVD